MTGQGVKQQSLGEVAYEDSTLPGEDQRGPGQPARGSAVCAGLAEGVPGGEVTAGTR